MKCTWCGAEPLTRLGAAGCKKHPRFEGKDPLEALPHSWGMPCPPPPPSMDVFVLPAPTDPKAVAASPKVNLHLVTPAALIEEAKVMANGAFKYGPYNFRDKGKKLKHTTYINAALRHIYAHLDGQDFDPGAGDLVVPFGGGEPTAQPYTLVRNLAAARASLGILIDCILTGHVEDDRPRDGVTGDLLYPKKEEQ